MIGVYGGMFDPVHFGHLRPALDILSELSLSEIRFVPCGIPAHRADTIASAQQRCAMLELAMGACDAFVLDRREIARSGPAYMIDTLESVQQEFTAQRICLLVGMDAFKQFTSWHRWQAILSGFHLVVAGRPGQAIDDIENNELREYVTTHRYESAEAFRAASAPAVYFCEVTQLDISSTRIRELVATGRSIQYLVPETVADYIAQHGLYLSEVSNAI